jgi:hypothetical protein
MIITEITIVYITKVNISVLKNTRVNIIDVGITTVEFVVVKRILNMPRLQKLRLRIVVEINVPTQ